ncbi:MAG TPA: OsmC family protein [Anaerolineae bacterium]|nr:OsmC family protein [Anaerolineae bacterium]HMR64131.1 OsmC family protein [Anaerolineae bacterium]
MPVRQSTAVWQGTLKDGKGTVRLGGGAFEGPYSFASRFEEGAGTNPEELIGAAHAGCFSQALALMLTQAGYSPEQIHTTANVHLNKVGDGFKITSIELDTEVRVTGIDSNTFNEKAQAAKEGCPVSQALAGVEITLKSKLLA